jgi:hypothetical protein
MASRLVRFLLSLPRGVASLDAQGIEAGAPPVRRHLERVLEAFVVGYDAALEQDDQERVAQGLRDRLDAHHLGFAFEGAGLYYGARDLLVPRRSSRLRAFVEGPARDHDYIATVGAGFALARLPWGLRAWPGYTRRLDPLVAWCLVDGYGFHQGLFQAERYVVRREPPPAALPAFARPLFDAGLGRSLWWSRGAEPELIAAAIGAFPAERRGQMWSGVGLAATYAGGVDDAALLKLRALAGAHLPDLIAGVPFATRMRQKGGNPSPVTERACRVLLGCDADAASDWIVGVVGRVLEGAGAAGDERLRDSYLLVRRQLLLELRPRTWTFEPRRTGRAAVASPGR